MPLYRIAWRSLLTGYTDHGSYVDLPLVDIQQAVEWLNKKHIGTLTHWVEKFDE